MDFKEFHCKKCDALLRVSARDQDKWIRCPKCAEVQSYVDATSFRSVEGDEGSTNYGGPTSEESWSLRTADGQEYHQLNRQDFEQLLRQGHAQSAAYFIGGEYQQWTPVQRLFQSAAGAHRNSPPTDFHQASPQQAVHGSPYQTSGAPNAPLTYEQQLSDGYGTYVLVLGIISMVIFCVPIPAIVGLILGALDAVRIANGDVSTRYQTRGIIGMVLCTLSLLILSCFGCRVRIG